MKKKWYNKVSKFWVLESLNLQLTTYFWYVTVAVSSCTLYFC